MQVYRISTCKYINDLGGTGAALYGGRWNPVSFPLLYTSGSISLACLEYLAHNFQILKTVEVCMAVIEIPSSLSIEEVPASDLPEQWSNKLHPPLYTQYIGKRFIEKGEHPLLKVPSAIVPQEFNYLINPAHPEQTRAFRIRRVKRGTSRRLHTGNPATGAVRRGGIHYGPGI